MTSFREARENCLFAYADNTIDCDTFALRYDINKSKNLDLPYTDYERFDLDRMRDDESISEFCFWKNDIYILNEALRIPDQMFSLQ